LAVILSQFEMYNNKPRINALKIVNLFFVLIIFTWVKINAQDIHFSQFKSTPLFINPANTGNSASDIRFSNDYRNQWRSIDYPYNTLMAAFDTRISFLGRRAGIGAILVHDQSSGNYLNADKFFLSVSHSFFYKNNQFVVGLQPGYVLKRYNNSNITFGNQFDPNSHNYDPNLPSNENNLNEKLNYFDLNLGLLWQARIKTFVPMAGISINHINRPTESFYADNSEKPLPLKYTVHGSIFIPLTEKYSVEPQALFGYTKGSKEFIIGALANYYTGLEKLGLSRVYGIGSFRSNPVRNFDAMILGAGAEILGFDVCFTYDINVSSLRKASKFQGASEISLVYTTNRKKNSHKAEPCFML
jgi:type IX secretion system PorP/SprF family membrane protein